jgi:hypothetical protein
LALLNVFLSLLAFHVPGRFSDGNPAERVVPLGRLISGNTSN